MSIGSILAAKTNEFQLLTFFFYRTLSIGTICFLYYIHSLTWGKINIQSNALPGEKFNIEHEGRYFEVVVPSGSQPGETITIVGLASSTPFNSFKDLQDAAISNALALNSYFKVQERALVAKDTLLNKVSEIDAKYEITKMPLVVTSTALATKYAELAMTKVMQIDEKLKIVEKAKEIGSRIVVYAMEIDAKFCISATTARLLVNTSNAVVQTYTGAKDRVVVPGIEFVSKKSEQVVDYVSKTKDAYFPAPAPAIAAK